MKSFYWNLALSALSASASSAFAAAAVPPAVTTSSESRLFVAGDEIAERISKADAAAKGGPDAPRGPLLKSGPYQVLMVRSTEPQPNSETHPNEAELFVVVEGSGAFLIGGKLIDPKPRAGSSTLTSPTTEGGTEYKVKKGDAILVPENTPHKISAVTSNGLVLMSTHLARPNLSPNTTTE